MTNLATAAGLALGVVADAVAGDPRRGHPVAGFGRCAAHMERWTYQDSRSRGALHTALLVGASVTLGGVVRRWSGAHPSRTMLTTAVATWTVLGGTSLAREGRLMSEYLTAGDLPAARARLSYLCARDPSTASTDELARATVESLAENASDAVVAPLLWGAVAGVPGLLGYRAVNTLDAMIGYRSVRYRRFGTAAARLDDLMNLVPARVTAALIVISARLVGGSARGALAVTVRDARRHPSPNAGYPEAAAAGALGVRLGGSNTYHGVSEVRAELGDGPGPGVADINRMIRLGQICTVAATGLAMTVAVVAAMGRGAEPTGPRTATTGETP